ncbi:uncharacterized protein LOC124137543 [Haliotis rufescens]|uniref:uncharacterized protein LOC124137543 n=1 Tax=Haliotis rufescens TaxID=6454 RepID=UPI00201EE2AB|nr:uncharacterized protein LOC124137543 [Haliotis rufescens]
MRHACVLLLVMSLYLARDCVHGGKYKWMPYDHYDELVAKFISVQAHNCKSKSKDALYFRDDAVSQLPKYNQLLTQAWYVNRTALIHLHNMALNRAFFFSYILQKMNDTTNFHIMPNWLYMYMSVTADVNANPYGLNGSAIYFDTNCSYPNWYTTVNFNNTLPRFAPKAWRWDDYRDQDNYLREATRRTVMVSDIGAGRGSDYTDSGFKMNPWYQKWLPDVAGDMDSLTKFTYNVGIRYSNGTGSFTHKEFLASNFFGPSSPSQNEKDERMLPVVWTKPYYDCGRANKWVLSATSPVVDYMPRYSNWTHLRRQRFVGVITMDIDFNQIDFNACPVSIGNPGPSFLSGVSRCKTKTTGCKHKPGFKFKRGGYVCVCRPGYSYPKWIDPPFQGVHIEQATEEEYKTGFQCTSTDFRQVLPVVDTLEGVTIEGGSNTLTSGGVDLGTSSLTSRFKSRRLRSINESYEEEILVKSEQEEAASNDNSNIDYGYYNIPNIYPQPEHLTIKKLTPKHVMKIRKGLQNGHRRYISKHTMRELREYWRDKYNVTKTRRKRSTSFDPKAFNRMMSVFRHKESVTAENCHTKEPSLLQMAGDVGYGVNKQFEMEARTALRLAHFISNYLQNNDPNENFGNLRGGGRLHVEHLFGEVIANVMSNFKIRSSGVFFDRNQFVNQDDTVREFFGPLAFKKEGSFYSVDTAGLPKHYVDEDWYREQKGRWGTNTEGLKTYKMRSLVRSDPAGTSTVRHEYFPLRYKAPAYTDGTWGRPTFKCDGRVDEWVMTYVVPFFGFDQLRRKLLFKGVVTVDVPLSLLEINQCPQNFYVANAFKNTAKCDQLSTKCGPLAGFKFLRGSYRCTCREGFEYGHMDGKFWIEGSLLELEWEKKIRGLFSRFDALRCRTSSSSVSSYSGLLVGLSAVISLIWTKTDYWLS